MLSCRTCYTKLILVETPQKAYHCEECAESYPIVHNIPILVKNPGAFLARTFLYNDNFIRYQHVKIDQIAEVIGSTQGRAESLLKIKNGLTENLSYLKRLQEILNPFIDKEEILNLLQSKEEISFYGGTLDYLKRDWTWDEDGEKELEVIYNTLSGFTNKYLKQNTTNGLVIGAGAGRTAWDLCNIFDNVYAVDSSFCLVSYFHTLLNENIRFNHINDRNVYSIKDMVLPYEASLHPPDSSVKPQHHRKLNFFAGYATKIFLPSESMDLITSIYFTDILPFRELLNEVNRMLKTGGLFIHFGPLGYHFSDPENCFSAEEIKIILEQNNFTILEEVRVVSPHTYSRVSMNMNVLNNWAFVAVKNTPPVQEKLTLHTRLKVAKPVNYTIKGVVMETGEDQSVVTIKLYNSEIYEGSALILEILKLCNDRKVSEVIEEITEMYGTDADLIKDNILVLINDLYKNGILMVTND